MMTSSMNPENDRNTLPEGAIVDFNEIQSELNYRQAKVALQDLVSGVDLSIRSQD
jgi:hypothetical protein